MQKKRETLSQYGELDEESRSRIIEMAWEDRTPFEAIKDQFGFGEKAVIHIMRQQLKRRSYENWRSRVTARVTKHAARRPASVLRHHCPTQYKQRSGSR
ncbi:MAG: TIGR03643 family protein [Halioglobus sp.]